MKRILPFFLLILGFSITTIAQDITITDNTVEVGVYLDGQNYYGNLYFTNNTSTSMEVEWERITNDLPANWVSLICVNGGQCYTPEVDASPANEGWIIPAGQTQWLKVQIQANEATGALPGTATVVIRMKDKNNPTSFAEGTVNASGFATSNNNIDVSETKIYPNPANDFITISNAEGISSIEVYNLIGRKVKVFTDVTEGSTFDVSDLPKGMYLLRLLDEENDVLITKRISKR